MSAISDFGWIAGSLLHGSGWGCALRVEAHFDESGTDANELTVAGYIFEAERIGPFSEEWNALLASYNLPYFHMVDCAHGSKPFDQIRKDDRIKLQMKLMNLIKRYAINGIVCNIQNIKDNSGASYLEAVRGAVRMALDWADKVAFDGKIAYFFEAGANGRRLADGHFQQIASDPASSAAHRYDGYAFLPKIGNPGVQAADLLAWQYHNFTKKRSENNLARLDLRALLRHPHYISDNCGDPPRSSAIQTIAASRSHIETICYLTKTKALPGDSVLQVGADKPLFGADTRGQVLACPNCLRAVAENTSIADIWNRFTVDKRLVIRCWCKTDCAVPRVMAPLAR